MFGAELRRSGTVGGEVGGGGVLIERHQMSTHQMYLSLRPTFSSVSDTPDVLKRVINPKMWSSPQENMTLRAYVVEFYYVLN